MAREELASSAGSVRDEATEDSVLDPTPACASAAIRNALKSCWAESMSGMESRKCADFDVEISRIGKRAIFCRIAFSLHVDAASDPAAVSGGDRS
jgi:hypothetical protein